jgi:hypothetical protein
MKALIAVFGACLLVQSARADNYTAAEQQARNASGKITARENQAISGSSPASPAPNTPAVDPLLQATLRNIASLAADIAGLGNATNAADTNAAASQKQMLMNDLAAAATGAKPSPVSISKLGDDLAAVVAGNEKLRTLPARRQKLAQDVHAIFNSSHLSAAQSQMIFDDVQKVLQNSDVSSDQIATVINDLKAIAAATK